MPKRRLPDSGITRLKAMQLAKERKDAVPPPVFIPLIPATITRLDTFYPAFKLKIEAAEAALQAQTTTSLQVKATRPDAEMLISHFYQALQNAIARGDFETTVRAFYGLAVNDGKVPVLNSEADIVFWGDKAAIGEAARIAAGGTAIPFPTIANVNTKVNAFKAANQLQANAKDAFDLAQEAVETDNPEADKLVLKMWNEIEAAFDEGNKPSMRRKAREWGVAYTISTGETISPDEFSIVGTVTDSVTGLPVSGAAVIVNSPEVIVLTDAQGKYYVPVVPAGDYNMHVHKDGYTDQDLPSVTVTTGAITTVNFQLVTAFSTIFFEGDLAMGNISSFEMNNLDIVAHPNLNFIFENLSTSTFRYYAAAAPAELPGAGAVLDVAPGLAIPKTIAQLITELGFNETNHYLNVFNVGPLAAHFKVIIEE